MPTMGDVLRKADRKRREKAELDRVAKQRKLLKEEGERVKKALKGAQAKTQELNALRKKVRTEQGNATKDLQLVNSLRNKARDDSAENARTERRLFDEAKDFKKGTDAFGKREKELEKKESTLRVNQANLSQGRERLAGDRRDFSIERDDFRELAVELNQRKVTLENKELVAARLETEAESLIKRLKKELEDAGEAKETYERKLISLKNYENELELKSLQLRKYARDKKIKADIKKLKKELGD